MDKCRLRSWGISGPVVDLPARSRVRKEVADKSEGAISGIDTLVPGGPAGEESLRVVKKEDERP